MWNFALKLLLLIFIINTITTTTMVSAADHIVGANKGWNPGINYTIWANNQTFYVGDLISFRYAKNQYNVFEVNKTGYDNCTVEGATGNWSKGKDFILLDKAQRYYFICGTGGCYSGMKVTVLVHPLPSPPPSKNHTSDDQKSAATQIVNSRSSSLALLVSLVLLPIWFFGGNT